MRIPTRPEVHAWRDADPGLLEELEGEDVGVGCVCRFPLTAALTGSGGRGKILDMTGAIDRGNESHRRPMPESDEGEEKLILGMRWPFVCLAASSLF